mgnify:FL=1
MSKSEVNINTNNVNLKGKIYINGDLNITDSNIYSDAILYVDGDVNITNSTLQGLGNEGTLILFATGEIYLGNISEYSNQPSIIKAFLYSDSTINLFGLFSNIEIHGGVSANKVILTSVRGKFTSSGSADTVVT